MRKAALGSHLEVGVEMAGALGGQIVLAHGLGGGDSGQDFLLDFSASTTAGGDWSMAASREGGPDDPEGSSCLTVRV